MLASKLSEKKFSSPLGFTREFNTSFKQKIMSIIHNIFQKLKWDGGPFLNKLLSITFEKEDTEEIINLYL